MSDYHMSAKDARREAGRLAARIGAPLKHGSIGIGINAIRSAARTLNRISEDECNGRIQPDGFMGWSDADQNAADKRRAKAERRAMMGVAMLFREEDAARFRVGFQGDPRGAPIQIFEAGANDSASAIACFW